MNKNEIEEKGNIKESEIWSKYFSSIHAVCPWSQMYWEKQQLEIVEWTGEVFDLNDDCVARVYKFPLSASIKELEDNVLQQNKARPLDVWLYSYPNIDQPHEGYFATPVPSLIQQNKSLLEDIRQSMREKELTQQRKILETSKGIEIVDNFVQKEYFNQLFYYFCQTNFPWNYIPTVAYSDSDIRSSTEKDSNLFYMIHTLYMDDKPMSENFEMIEPLLKSDKLKIKSVLRARVLLFPNTSIVHEHPLHTDFDFSHNAILLYLNTCDGYTKFSDGTKVDSVANRLVKFDGSVLHSSSTTTNTKARFVLSVNYF